MRLTLRTMLAYMDGILDTEDAQDIGKKIDDSQYATGLMHRIRDVMRRLRLAAPGLSDRGPNLDSNTVAEYLDNTLSDERVPDFEKVCLESDMHLAEVASCHQILTLVLGEPAEVDPVSRQRMYQIPQVLAAQMASDERITVAPQLEERAPATAIDPTPRRPGMEVPDYLRQTPPKRRLAPVLVGMAILAAVVVVALFVFGQFDPNTPLGKLIGRRDGVAQPVGRPEIKSPDAASSVAGSQVGLPPTADQQPSTPTQNVQSGNPPAMEDANNTIARLPAVDSPPVAVEPRGDTPDATVEAGAGNPPQEPPLEAPAHKPVGDLAANETPVAPPKNPAHPAEVPANATPIGRLISDKQVLLAHDSQHDRYLRVAPKTTFLSGTRLLVLPTYRPEIGLSMGAHLRLLGGTEITLMGPDAQAQAGANVFFGRVVIMPLASPGARLRLTVGDCTGVLTLAQAESVAALEVMLGHMPGSDPEKTPARVVSTLYVSSGDVLWENGLGGKVVRMTGPQQMVLDAQASPSAIKELPKWIHGETLGLLDARASAMIEQIVTPEKAAQTTLMELDEHRQKELRWLAARSLIYMDRFETLVGGLNNPELKAEWPEYMTKLTEALALGPETAAAVRNEFSRQYSSDGLDAYRMLWGYTEESLQNGGAAKLVKSLDHEILALRVLAYLNLKEITGAGLLYRPEQTAAQRKQSTQRWKERLATGEIRFKGAESEPGRGASLGATSDSIRRESK